MNYYQNVNPYYMQQQMPRIQPMQPMEQQYNQFLQPQYKANNSLQGKTVDSIDVVKATDIPLDRERKLLSNSRRQCYCNKTTSTRWK